MWNFVHASVVGTAHQARSIPCQDSSGAVTTKIESEPVLLLAISDGAGSAKCAQEGSSFVAQNWLKVAPDFLMKAELSDEMKLREIANAVRENLSAHVTQAGGQLEDYACTLLSAALYPDRGLFFQIGDGAWVSRKGETYQCPTWPSQGEYASETIFLTSLRHKESYQTAVMENICGVAGFTDGIERLALKMADRKPSPSFFTPMFAGVAPMEKSRAEEQLKLFLESDRVNTRTDDDKTLVLAWRTAPTP